MKVSVVIIARNEAHIIGNTLQSLEGLTDDIVVADSGSTDGTLDICKQYKARIIPIAWQGYGVAKNCGNNAAKYDWILSLDADEALDETLKQQILKLDEKDDQVIYAFRFKNYFGKKHIRFGEWGNDRHNRLFNKKQVRWNDAGVHEGLLFSKDMQFVTLKGNVLHYTADNLPEYQAKTKEYARLNAEKYKAEGKMVSPLKKYLSAAFNFLRNYVLRLGFLDGKAGFQIARNTASYTFLKYAYLEKLNNIRTNQCPK
jgi:glycosyltransferase involved in cell wall biosynthesis